MLILVEIDIFRAKLSLFEEYEQQVLALLGNYNGVLLARLRSTDDKREVHLLEFPDGNSVAAFRIDPKRIGLQVPLGF